MKHKRVLIGFMTILLVLGGFAGLGWSDLFQEKQEKQVAKAADGDNVATITFKTDGNYLFEGGKADDIVYTTNKEAIETIKLPMFQYNPEVSFVGWRLDAMSYASTTLHPNDLEVGNIYQPYELLRKGFYQGDEAVFTAIYDTQGVAGSTDIYEKADDTVEPDRAPSIENVSSTNAGVYLYTVSEDGNPELDSSYTLNLNGMQSALYAIYTANSAETDYIIQVQGGLTGTTMSNSSIGRRTENPSSSADVSFYSLKGRAKSLTVTGRSSDPITNNPVTGYPSQANTSRLTLPTEVNLGTDVEFRNISILTTNTIAANGNNLTLGGGLWGNVATTVYGGSANGTEVQAKPDATISVSSTGRGAWNIYGANNSGTYNGDSRVVVHNTSNNIGTLAGSNNGGTQNGDSNVVIHNINSTIATLAGGTNTGTQNGNTHLHVYDADRITTFNGGTNSGTINGDVNTFVRVEDPNSNFSMTTFNGGGDSGHINGNITSYMSGYGGWSGNYTTENYINFNGAGNRMNVGALDSKKQIVSIADTSLFTTGTAYFSGANQRSGIVHADILNLVRGGNYRRGSFIGVNGMGSRDSDTLSRDDLGATGVAHTTNLSSTDPERGNYTVAYDGLAPEQRASQARRNSSYSVFGNIYTHALGGTLAHAYDEYGYMRGGGFGGYIEGNTTVETGIIYGAGQDKKAGGYNFVRNNNIESSNSLNDLKYLVSPSVGAIGYSGRTHGTCGPFDIVGGTGRATSGDYGAYLFGNSKLIHNNVLARWTYGSGFGGVHEGNSEIVLNGGLVDTLEGSGYTQNRHFGTSNATMHNGEVNFFFSGGGWGDWAMFGDVFAIAHGGVINCAIGASYGYNENHWIFGDANTVVTGGRFDGQPSSGNRGFSGGITTRGHLYGDATLTLDLRNSNDFVMPSGTKITAGRPELSLADSNANELGRNADNDITLNIYTAPGTNVLNGATIYGDAGYDINNFKSGKVNINIDAPNSAIGDIYPTRYRNNSVTSTTTGVFQKSVDINILRAKSINQLSGGNATDNITNTIADNMRNASRFVDVQLGTILPENPLTDYKVTMDDVNKLDEEQPEINSKKINFGTAGSNSLGLVNFTSLSIENGFTALVDGNNAKIANGRLATAQNHYNTYDKFGDAVVQGKSAFGVTASSGSMSLGKMTIEDKGTVYSSPGAGVINLSSIDMGGEGDLTWYKQSGGANKVSSVGNYFGATNAYQVLTFSASDNNGNKIENMGSDLTPANFRGLEEATGKTFVGDADTSSAQTNPSNYREYGIMIPGSVINFEVIGDYDPGNLSELLSAGTGRISHNVTNVTTDLNNIPEGGMDAFATVAADEQVKKGMLVIPIKGENPIYPTLTFDPDDETGSWLRKATIDSTKVGEPDEVINEQENSEPVKWIMKKDTDANEYSYDIKVVFSNQLELTGKNIIVKESVAKTLTSDTMVQAMQEVFGRPFLKSKISEADLTSLQAGLEGQLTKKIPITYHIQDHKDEPSENGTREEKWNIVVVPDGSVIHDDKDFALYASDCQMTLIESAACTAQEHVDVKTNAMVVYADDRENGKASLDGGYVTNIREAAAMDTVPITYTATLTEETKERTLELGVNVRIVGEITFAEVTDVFDFGNQKVTGTKETYWPNREKDTETPGRGHADIVIKDTRGDNLTWNLSVRELVPLTDANNNRTLAGLIYYQSSENATPVPIPSDVALLVQSSSNGIPGTDYIENFDVTESWETGKKGVQLTLPPEAQRAGSYKGELEWTLSYTP